MASPNTKDELLNELKQLSSKKKWLAIAYLFVHSRSNAKDVLQETVADLLSQNTDGVKDVNAFLKQVITNKAKAFFKKSTITTVISEAEYDTINETTDTLFAQMEMEVIMNAIKQHRDKLDFILFSMHVQGYDYEEIAKHTGEKAGTLRHRMFNLRNWLKRFFVK
jgi:RNA polymerase sigma-70 factor (ECF subfamily)